MFERELVSESVRREAEDRDVEKGVERRAAEQQPGVSDAGGISGGNERRKKLWKSRCVGKSLSRLFHSSGDDGLSRSEPLTGASVVRYRVRNWGRSVPTRRRRVANSGVRLASAIPTCTRLVTERFSRADG